MVNDWLGITIFHYLGIIGSVLMLSGVIYSIKKRWQKLWGSTPFWLKHHEFVSAGGAILVVVHAEGSFDGLAGISIILMVIITISGFLGHYIYTRIPRNSMGKEKKLVELRTELDNLTKDLSNGTKSRENINLDAELRKKILRLERQIKNLETARRLMSGWRAWHIPMTIIFLISVIMHIVSTLYFGNYFG
jgi:ABC-type transport system involved in cytochrome bd biosynthesis fused ATPase/permease subunit